MPERSTIASRNFGDGRRISQGPGRRVAGRRRSLARLDGYTAWEDLDWESLVNKIADLNSERERILAASDQLAALTEELQRVEEADRRLRRNSGRSAEAKGRCRVAAVGGRGGAGPGPPHLSDRAGGGNRRETFEAIELPVASRLGQMATDTAAMTDTHQAVGSNLRDEQSKALSTQNRVGQRIIALMGEFRTSYPQETSEHDVSVEAGVEYRQHHQRVAEDDLPRFEQEFKDYLNQNTIRDIAGFSAQLNKQEKLIRDRIETINGSLVDIDYNDGRYIRLVPDHTPNTDVREFRTELRGLYRRHRRYRQERAVLGTEIPTSQAHHRPL